MYYFLKRCLDIFGALSAALIFSPILLVSIIAVYLQMGTPIFFRQTRSGKNKKSFCVLKFRSMIDDNSNTLSDEQRITTLGSFLRKYSVDELPQLWNVLKGDMSLVGPRPLLTEYDDKYSNDQNRRFEVQPGITGWAQINGRNELTWEEKLRLDTEYVETRSLSLDIRILFATVWVVLASSGFRPAGEYAKFGDDKIGKDHDENS